MIVAYWGKTFYLLSNHICKNSNLPMQSSKSTKDTVYSFYKINFEIIGSNSIHYIVVFSIT